MMLRHLFTLYRTPPEKFVATIPLIWVESMHYGLTDYYDNSPEESQHNDLECEDKENVKVSDVISSLLSFMKKYGDVDVKIPVSCRGFAEELADLWKTKYDSNLFTVGFKPEGKEPYMVLGVRHK